ncbi:MAG TPA: hypothetical protein VNI52_03365 [Sphingobacteriaceae bacterium]|nr:hypothetical protein [Sphingobacteriaceae bacterium]
MKKLKLSCISACLVLFMVASCGKDHSKQIARTWTVSDIEASTTLQDSVKTKMLSNSQMVFTKDGQYTANGGIGTDQGSYTLDKDGKSLSTMSDAGKGNQVYTIDKLTDDKLVLKNSGNTITCVAKN